jgi:diguanylate cyclase (GGDEF)-like protein
METNINEYFIRTDQVTGCKNLIAFAELITLLCSQKSSRPYSLVVIDINHFKDLNERHGDNEGNNVLRWVGLLSQEILQTTIYRIDGDEFVAVINNDCHSRNFELAYNLFEQLNHHAKDFDMQVPLTKISVIHYFGNEILKPPDFFAQIYCSIGQVKNFADRSIKEFRFDELDPEGNTKSLRRFSDHLVERLINLGKRLEESLELAFQDPITELPNQRAAQNQLEKYIAKSLSENKTFSVLLIDGDDLHRYNEISYAKGDEMIRLLGKTIRQSLRPEDFLARWRVGDEFLVLLAGENINQGVLIGKRICEMVQQTSMNWLLPVTVSIGAVSFPEHGSTVDELIHYAELANSISKKNGKNQVTQYLDDNA